MHVTIIKKKNLYTNNLRSLSKCKNISFSKENAKTFNILVTIIKIKIVINK